MVRKLAIVLSVLSLAAVTVFFLNTTYAKKHVVNRAGISTGNENALKYSGGQSAPETPPGPEAALPPTQAPGLSLEKIDVQAARGAYDKAAELAARTPEINDIKALIPVLIKFTPQELVTLTRLASRKMTREETEEAKGILLSRLSSEDVDLLLELGPKYGLDFRYVLGAEDRPKGSGNPPDANKEVNPKSQQEQAVNSTNPLRSQIEQKYTDRLYSLASAYEARLDSLVQAAANEYGSVKKNNPNADLTPLINKYYSAGKALEAECDAKFHAILGDFERELKEHAFPPDRVREAKEAYEARKSARAGQITSAANP